MDDRRHYGSVVDAVVKGIDSRPFLFFLCRFDLVLDLERGQRTRRVHAIARLPVLDGERQNAERRREGVTAMATAAAAGTIVRRGFPSF